MHGLLETLERHARENPDRLAYLWLDDGEREGQRLTYGQLLMRVRVWSGAIARSAQPGDRALLQFPDGLEVLCALLGCFHAGVIAVPAPLPHHRLGRSALDKIVEDCTPALTLSPNTELGEEARVRRHHDIGYLQYTSGSTSAPRGVKISHRNVACNVEMMRQAWELPQDGAPMVSWLPIFHDMGLVAKALLALWSGVPCVFMAPTAFLAKPMRWLRAIHRYGAQLSGSPNFGFELCVKKSTPQEREELDLSSWRVAFNGAEPVRASTLDKFSQAFAISGFRPSALYSAYGLAEATVFVGTSRPNRVQVDLEGLGRHQVVPGSHTLVSTGMDPEVRVVDPESHQLCAPDQVGEVWVRGKHVSDGYWNRTEGPFGARLQPDGPADYLRTGDLAFYKDGELFITGRLKDLVILRGRNHYPQDLELCAEESHPQVRPGCTAAFSLEIEGEERLGMVAEVAGPDDLSAAIAAIRSRLSLEHGVELARLELIPRGTLPKTSSGKVQRSRTRAMMLAGEFRPLASWSLAPTAEPDRGTNPLAEGSLEGWLRAHLGGRLEKDRPLAEHGIDSLRAVELVEGLAQFSLRRLEPHQLWQFSTVADLLAWLGGDDTVTLPVSVGSSEDEAWLREPIAVIGLGCRFAGAGNVEEYWELLRQGRDGLAESPGGKIPGRDLFDARFFRIGPAEARSMDPQQRVLLETVWHALEHAHLPAQQLRGSNTGVFLGLSSHDYGRLLQGAGVLDAWSGLGNAASVAAGRISYALGLHGPSLAVDTACSSSLLAVHLACQSLRTGECDLALAGGVNLILSPDSDEELSRLGALSPNGRCFQQQNIGAGGEHSDGFPLHLGLQLREVLLQFAGAQVPGPTGVVQAVQHLQARLEAEEGTDSDGDGEVGARQPHGGQVHTAIELPRLQGDLRSIGGVSLGQAGFGLHDALASQSGAQIGLQGSGDGVLHTQRDGLGQGGPAEEQQCQDFHPPGGPHSASPPGSCSRMHRAICLRQLYLKRSTPFAYLPVCWEEEVKIFGGRGSSYRLAGSGRTGSNQRRCLVS
jgi:acyl-CoA synthetase (AMP-forming)/AMP-acid ligase II/acyl carrier protein